MPAIRMSPTNARPLPFEVRGVMGSALTGAAALCQSAVPPTRRKHFLLTSVHHSHEHGCMKQTHLPSRRDFIRTSGQFAAVSALAGIALPHVHAEESNTIRLALIGCGGRGSGAVANAMSAGGLVLGDDSGTTRAPGSVTGGPVKLHAMADLRQDRLDQAHQTLTQTLGDRVDAPPERRFLGFDAYRNAIDCLRPGDVAMLTTHAAFRAGHLEYAVEKGVNVFMEKDFAADPGGIKRIIRAGEAAEKKNLKIAAGLMCRHSSARQALIQKIRDGAMGDIQLIRAYRMDSGYLMGPFPEARMNCCGN